MILIPASLPELRQGSGDALGLIRRLENGAVLTGRVHRPAGEGGTPIQIGSTIIQLVLTQNLQPGTVVHIRSENGNLFVEAQEEGGEGQSNPTPRSTPGPATGNPASILFAHGSDTTQLFARVLQSQQLPAHVETLQVLQTVLGKFPPDQAPVLALLLARNIPITSENLTAVKERLRTRGNFGRELGHLSAEVVKLLNTGQIRGSGQLSGVLVHLQELLSWDQTGSLEERVARLKDFLSTFEEKLLGGDTDKARLDFKALLLELDFLLDQAELPQSHPLRAAARKSLHLIEGAQLSALPQVGQPNRESWVFWRIPFPGDPSPTTVELAVRGERDPEHPERYNPGNLEILIQVDLSTLGPLRVRIRNLAGEMHIALSVTEKKYRDYLVKEIPILIETLQNLGHSQVAAEVLVEPIAPGSLADELDPLKESEKHLEEPAPSVDIRL